VTAARELTARPGQTHRGYPVQRALRTLAIVFSVALYMLVAPFGYLGFAFLCWWWRGDPHRRAFELQRLMGVGYRILHDWLRTFRIADFDHRGALPDLPTGPCILVANHPTQIDVTAIGASLGGACTIVKRAVYRRKLVRPLLVGAGLLEGPGTDPISIGQVIDDGVRRIEQGMRIFVFPEGSRSPAGDLRPFGRVAFEIACRTGAPLVTIGIRCEPVWLSHEVPMFRPPHPIPKLRLHQLAIDDPRAFGGDSRQLRERVERRLREWVGAPSTGDR
jgi:1-acyl-sn-glycerol-3-phosphate acyltransferase